MLKSTPYVHARISDRILYQDLSKETTTDCYIVAVQAFLNRPLLYTVHTQDGALYSGVPIQYISHEEVETTGQRWNKEALDPWSAIGNKISIERINYLKDYSVICRSRGFQCVGRYLFTINFEDDGGFTEDPEQAKIIHVIKLANGQFAQLPNNCCLWRDMHYTRSVSWPNYKRNSDYFSNEG